jgi:hypothetical protein
MNRLEFVLRRSTLVAFVAVCLTGFLFVVGAYSSYRNATHYRTL